MINKINLSTPNYNRMPFQGEKEVEMLVKKTNELPKSGSKVNDFGRDLRWMFEDKKISTQDILNASKQIKEEWKANLLKITAEGLSEL